MSISSKQATAERAPSTTNNGRGTQILLDNVTKDYGLAKPAVDSISLKIEPGEFMTLLGPSGSGKTTTLNLIAGFETLSAGNILLDSADVGKLPPHKRDLGMLFQNYALFPHMTVEQNVAYPLKERKLPKAEIATKVKDVLELVQLTGRNDNLPSQLSGGQQQRVALARAIVFNPRALLLDEPLGALDRNLRAALQLEIRRIHREVGATFVFVTHDQDEAMTLSDRIALFNDGHIEQVGPPEELYNSPETLFTAKFLGDSNVFELGEGAVGQSVEWEGKRWGVEEGTVAARAGVLSGKSAIVVRPEAINIAKSQKEVPSGANSTTARVRDIEYMGSHRTLVLGLGAGNVAGRATVSASDRDISLGDELVAWWRADAQRIVAA